MIGTLIDPRFKNHANIFGHFERTQNIALLQTELELHHMPERRNSLSPLRVGVQNTDDPMADFLSTSQEVSILSADQSQGTVASDISTKISLEIHAYLGVIFIFNFNLKFLF